MIRNLTFFFIFIALAIYAASSYSKEVNWGSPGADCVWGKSCNGGSSSGGNSGVVTFPPSEPDNNWDSGVWDSATWGE